MSTIHLIRHESNENVTAKDDATLFEKLSFENGIFYGMELRHLAENKVLITAGRGIYKGQDFIVEEQVLQVALSDSGEKNGRIYIRINLGDTVNPIQIMSVVSEGELPELAEDPDFNNNLGIGEMELATYTANELLISNLQRTCMVVNGFQNKMLSTLEELQANTTSGKLVDALVVKAILEMLGGVEFKMEDIDGNPTDVPYAHFWLEVPDEEPVQKAEELG